MEQQIIHFGSFDERFCGTKNQPRQFTFDPNEVTCPHCQGNDCFVLSAEAAEYVASLNAQH